METKRHSLAHIMAYAVQELYPGVKFAIGPAIENGFYYDFEFPSPISQEDLLKIEKKMKDLLGKDMVFSRKEVSKNEAKKLFKGQSYKLELIEELEQDKAVLYESGNFLDLCKGPHVGSAKDLKNCAFKLISAAGAYWRGNEKNKMLTRIYGIAFENEKELKDYLQKIEEAKKRDHRILGKQLELFEIYPEIGQGLPVWLANGYFVRRQLEDYMIKLERSYGYKHILTPHIGKDILFKTSGHLDFYKESMYSPMEIDTETYYLKPMNCPMGMIVYKSKPRSYKDLPMKVGEFGTVYRYEKSGELSGLSRVRGFTQNDAHIYCTPEQVLSQFLEVFEMLKKFYESLGFTNYKFRLGFGDPEKEKFKVCGTKEGWEKAENTIREALQKTGAEYYEVKGEAAFYGPKLDVQAIDPLGREESVSTIQIDFNMPSRFGLSYKKSNGKEEAPFVIHRALIGSFERFFAFLIEFYAGNFPVWLCPVQAIIIPITEGQSNYAKSLKEKMDENEIRAEINSDNKPMQAKIREAQLRKIPYMLIVGKKEEKENSVSVRLRTEKNLGSMPKENLIKRITRIVDKKSQNL